MDDQLTTTSFIPKTRIAGSVQRGKGIGLGILISGFILFVSLSLFAGVYFYKGVLKGEVEGMIKTLETARKAFDPSLVSELSRLDNSINSAEMILEQHKASSKILELIGKLTLKDVSFSNFSYAITGNSTAVSMSGEAKGYSGVALQAKLLEDNEFIDDVTFSGLSLKDAGKVSFSVKLTVKKEFLIYKLQTTI